jgi:hypothetical protein
VALDFWPPELSRVALDPRPPTGGDARWQSEHPSSTYPLPSLAVASVLAIAFSVAGTAAAKDGPPGFLTSKPAMITPVAPGSSVLPIITVPESGKKGEKSGWRFDALPDGIGFGISGKKDVTIYVNHETSTVPFPYNPDNPNPDNSQNDFDNAQLSEVTLSLKNAGVLSGSFVIPSSANYQRFCSNFLIGPAEGFAKPLLITNEEAPTG